jgi:hypothetical protein
MRPCSQVVTDVSEGRSASIYRVDIDASDGNRVPTMLVDVLQFMVWGAGV